MLSANSTLVLEEGEHKIPTKVYLCCAILCIVKDCLYLLIITYTANIIGFLIMPKGQMGNHPPENFKEPYTGSLGLCYTEPRVGGSI